jgi:hypothetical protein
MSLFFEGGTAAGMSCACIAAPCTGRDVGLPHTGCADASAYAEEGAAGGCIGM